MTPPSDVRIELAPTPRRWASPGGHEDETSITLYLRAWSEDGTTTRDYHVILPLEVDRDGRLALVDPTVQERAR